MPALELWMNGEHVGTWAVDRRGQHRLNYASSWIESSAARPLSLSLPITIGGAEHRGDVVANYFDNLLPDNQALRERLAVRFRTRSLDPFALLSAIGRDCVGAVQLLPEGVSPDGWDRVQAERLTPSQVERLLRAASTNAPLGLGEDHDEFRISIAGAQEKTALLDYGGQWHIPLGATPTTHILKLPLGLVGNLRADMNDSVENEWLCLQLLKALGLPAANAAMAKFGEQRVLVVERFDRHWQGVESGQARKRGFTPATGIWIARLPQEDLCQALGVPPHLKYEAEGGPSMRQCLDVLASSKQAETDRACFVKAQLAFWVLAATDGHAKNFSIAHGRGAVYALTPLYDVLSAWPVIGKGANKIPEQHAKLAMAMRSKNAHYKLQDIHAWHWRALAGATGVPGLWDQLLGLIAAIEAAFNTVERSLPNDFPAPVWEAIRHGARSQAERFMREVHAASKGDE